MLKNQTRPPDLGGKKNLIKKHLKTSSNDRNKDIQKNEKKGSQKLQKSFGFTIPNWRTRSIVSQIEICTSEIELRPL